MLVVKNNLSACMFLGTFPLIQVRRWDDALFHSFYWPVNVTMPVLPEVRQVWLQVTESYISGSTVEIFKKLYIF